MKFKVTQDGVEKITIEFSLDDVRKTLEGGSYDNVIPQVRDRVVREIAQRYVTEYFHRIAEGMDPRLVANAAMVAASKDLRS